MTVYAAIAFGVAVVAIGAALMWFKTKSRDTLCDLKIIGSAGKLYHRSLKLFLATARDEDRAESWHVNRFAIRRHYKTGKLAQLCVDYSAMPLFPGMDNATIEGQRDFMGKCKKVLGKNAFHQRIGDNQREVMQETSRQTFRLVVIGTVIMVMVICIVVLLTSGKVNIF